MPQIENTNIPDEEEIDMPSRTYRLNTESLIEKYSIVDNHLVVEGDVYTDTIAGFVDDIDAIKQSVYHILNIERYSYEIYDDDYGVELQQYIGKGFDYLSSTINETLEDALTQDDRITGVEVTNIEQIKNDLALVNFSVFTENSEIEMEVEING